MLKVFIDTGRPARAEVSVSGSVPEVLADLSFVIADVYSSLKTANPTLAAAFRYGVRRMGADDNPLWTVQLHPGESSLTIVTPVTNKKGGPDHG